MFIGVCKGHRYKHTEFQCLIGIEKLHKRIECTEQYFLVQCFNTTYHYSLWVLALPVLSFCPTLLLSSPPQILRPLKGAAPHLLVPRHLKSSGAVERTPTSSLGLWFHLSTSHEDKHSGVGKRALPERKAKKSFQVTVAPCHSCR